MAILQSLGIGSGLDISSLVDSLVAASRDPVVSRLDGKQATIDAQLSAFGTINSNLSSFQSAAAALSSSLFKSHKATSTDDKILTASATSVADNGTFQVTVNKLAQSQSLATQALTATSDIFGGGTLNISFGTTVYDPITDTYTSFTADPDQTAVAITIAANSTLDNVRDAINSANAGIQASIVNDGSGFRLLLTSEKTGAINSMQISVTDDDGNDTDTAGLSRLAFNGTATNADQTVAAQDSETVVNGLTVTRSDNVLTGVINGVTLNLQSADTTKTITLNITQDEQGIADKVKTFVDAFNALKTTINTETAFNSEENVKGVLLGDSTVRSLSTQLRTSIFQAVKGLENAPIRSLAEVGLSTNKDTGILTFDEAAFKTALKNNPDDIVSLFTLNSKITDSQVEFFSNTSVTRAGNFAVNVTQLATQGTLVGASVLPVDFVATPLVIDANNDNFTIKVDGTTSGSITLTQGSFTSGASLALEIQKQINADSTLKNFGVSVGVTYDSVTNSFAVNSTAFGSTSTVEFTSVDTNTAVNLGFSVATGTAGVNVAGSINGVTAIGTGQFLTGAAKDDSDGLKLRITGGALGARGAATFFRGVADSLSTFSLNALANDGLLDLKTDALQKLISGIGGITEQRAALDLRLESLEARLLRQFNAMDSIVASIQTTSSFLEQQLKLLPFASPKK